MIIETKNRKIGGNEPAYFIADIGANHDGKLARAIKLIHEAARAGADAAKFQNFTAPKIVSDTGFKALGKTAHAAKWDKTVYQVFQECEINPDWTPRLKEECDKAKIDYFSTPYDFESADMLEPYVEIYKIGSGDITWHEFIAYIAKKAKPVILSTGASNMQEVAYAVAEVIKHNSKLILLQCNTNYDTGTAKFKHVNLNVLKTYQQLWPELILGLSGHSPGHSSVLGAVALGSKIIEKHFTDDTGRPGPDHSFAMNPDAWREMVDRTRELEAALGDGEKKVEANEAETVVVQRRCLRAARDITASEVIKKQDIAILRPAPDNSIPPYEIENLLGKKCRFNILKGEYFKKG